MLLTTSQAAALKGFILYNPTELSFHKQEMKTIMGGTAHLESRAF